MLWPLGCHPGEAQAYYDAREHRAKLAQAVEPVDAVARRGVGALAAG